MTNPSNQNTVSLRMMPYLQHKYFSLAVRIFLVTLVVNILVKTKAENSSKKTSSLPVESGDSFAAVDGCRSTRAPIDHNIILRRNAVFARTVENSDRAEANNPETDTDSNSLSNKRLSSFESTLLHSNQDFSSTRIDDKDDDGTSLNYLDQDFDYSSFSDSAVGVVSTNYGNSEDGLSEARDIEDDKNKIVTCKGRCGHEDSLPCSCDARCFVYKNCCENITFDCPEISKERYTKYGFLLGANVACHKYGAFMIASCADQPPRRKRSAGMEMPDISESRENPKIQKKGFVLSGFHRDTTSNHIFESESFDEFEKGTMGAMVPLAVHNAKNEDSNSVEDDPDNNVTVTGGRILNALKNAPVYDKNNSILYANFDIFLCYGGQESDAIRWETEFAMSGNDGLTTLEDIEERLIDKPPVYTPPSSLLTHHRNALTWCHRQPIGSEICWDNDLDLKIACEGFSSYVQTFKPEIYKNRFCFQCDEGQTTYYVVYHKDISGQSNIVDFGVTMSISKDKTIGLVFTDRESKAKIAWANAACGIDSIEASKCDIRVCKFGFALSSNGTCKMLHNTLLAFSDDGFPLTEYEKRDAPKFLVCLMEEYLGIEVADSNPSLRIVRSSNLNSILYITDISAFLPSYMSNKESIQTGNLTSLFAVIKAFQQYRKPRAESLCEFKWKRETPIVNQTSLDFAPTFPESLTFRRTRNYMNPSSNTDQNITDKSMNTFCFASSPKQSEANNELYCLQEPLYEWELTLVLEMCNSPCFSLLSENPENNRGLLNYKVPSLLFVTVVAIATQISKLSVIC